MRVIKIDKKKKLIILIVTLIILILSYISLVIYNIVSLQKYNTLILPNTYIDGFDFSNYSFENSKKIMNFYQDFVLSKKIKFHTPDQEYEYTLKDLGITIDQEKTLDKIKEYQEHLSYSHKLRIVHQVDPVSFSFLYLVSPDQLRKSLEDLKTQVDTLPIDGFFDTSEGVRYQTGVNGYVLDIDKSLEKIYEVLSHDFQDGVEVELFGESSPANTNETYATIDTMTSSFATTFIPNTYLRNINLNTALSYINGTIVGPGEVFSYCDKAGPFNKAGYVFYYEFVGNGVCQIATTTYNAALLGGLEIVKRYPHAKKSAYVDGGLDATVASYSSGWCVDMQFRNTYEYPIYIKAYSEGGRAHVEFWSNSQAKKGLEYTTSSTKIGVRGYKSYLHTWKDGQEIDVHEIATTWYTEE